MVIVSIQSYCYIIKTRYQNLGGQSEIINNQHIYELQAFNHRVCNFVLIVFSIDLRFGLAVQAILLFHTFGGIFKGCVHI